jgi:hypothetical protein
VIDDQLESLTVPELKLYCTFFRLLKRGNKAVLLQRIELHITTRFAQHSGMKRRQAVLQALADVEEELGDAGAEEEADEEEKQEII